MRCRITVLQLFLALASNALEVYNIPPPTKSKEDPPEASRLFSLDLPGHRTDVRTLCLSSDDMLLASASNGKKCTQFLLSLFTPVKGSLKIWNVKTTTCIRTLDCGYAICSTFLPGDRQVGRLLYIETLPRQLPLQIAVGTKNGEILVYDLASSSLIDTVKAHTATVWSMHVRADGQALVTGSADKDVKFWEFEAKGSQGDEVSQFTLLDRRIKLNSLLDAEWQLPLAGSYTNS